MTGEGQLRAWLDALAALGGAVSAAEAIVADADRVLFRHASGFRLGGEPLRPATHARFDAASLTKPWMATLALVLDASGELALAAPVGDLVAAADPGLARATLGDLLRHRAGLAAWAPLALRLGRRLGDRDELIDWLARATPATVADGVADSGRESTAQARYSDLGYLLWGLLAERALGAPLGDLLDQRVCDALGLASIARLSLDPPRAVECRLDNGKEVELAADQGLALGHQRGMLRGLPQDGNARALRAVGCSAGHAGLFLTAEEMLALARAWLRPGRLLQREQIASALAEDGDYALGWARWSAEGSSGPALPATSFGHTGFTGGSLWVDPSGARIFLLLAHRLSSRTGFSPLRREFHRLARAI